MKQFFQVLVELLIKIIVKVTAIFSKNPTKKTMLMICSAFKTKATYASFQIKPKKTSDIPVDGNLNQTQSLAIILQGPICTDYDMTYNTILFYKKVYPRAQIIVSTWEDEPEETVKKIEETGAVIVKSKKPENNGVLNVNYQIINSLAGIKEAKELGCTYAVKTRTDQRVCKPYIFDSMAAALETFPGGGGYKRPSDYTWYYRRRPVYALFYE